MGEDDVTDEDRIAYWRGVAERALAKQHDMRREIDEAKANHVIAHGRAAERDQECFRLEATLRPFADAYESAVISGRPPFEFVGAKEFEAAKAVLDARDAQ